MSYYRRYSFFIHRFSNAAKVVNKRIPRGFQPTKCPLRLKVTTGEQFETRKEAKERVGGKWEFERLVKNGEIRFIKDGNNIASDGLHYPKQGNRSLS